jgi:hypothetical protein
MERFWNKVERGDGCWEWRGAKSRFGYGRFIVGRNNRLAHRVAWAATRGEIPVGMNVCHRCDNPSCVNPDHLFLGTQRDNVRDMHEKGRAPVPVRPTHCIHGHELTGGNTYVAPKSGRSCKVCRRTADRRRYERRGAR